VAGLALAAVALASIGPFAQAIIPAVVLGLPLSVLGYRLGARRMGSFALLTLAAAVVVNPMIFEFRGAEYVALALAIGLLASAGILLSDYLKTRNGAGPTAER
jgi:hypothetical protein